MLPIARSGHPTIKLDGSLIGEVPDFSSHAVVSQIGLGMTSGEKYIRGHDLAPVLGTVTQVYTTASETLGYPIPPVERAGLWAQIPNEQALVLIAALLADIDLSTRGERKAVDHFWAAQVSDPHLRDQLLVSSRLGSTLFVPQLLLVATREVLKYCPSGPPTNTLSGLDNVVRCVLGIADEASSTESHDNWGGIPGGLAAEMIANQHFNRSIDIGHQLTWVDRAWFQDWPVSDRSTQTVGGQPYELFEEATGVRLEDFAAVAMNLYIQARRHVHFPPKFFDSIGLPKKAITHFLDTTSLTVDELRKRMGEEAVKNRGSLYAFDTVRRFPLVRLSTGAILVLRVSFIVERALSEVTYFDVGNYLTEVDKHGGTKRRAAFQGCTNKVLEYEAGVTLKRVFPRGKGQILSEAQLQNRFSSKAETASVCDFAVRRGGTWLLIEVTDRAIPRQIVFGQAAVAALDDELDRVLTDRKAGQLYSTIELLQKNAKTQKGSSSELSFIPLVLTAPGGLGWNAAVHRRVRERLSRNKRFSERFSSSVALITLKDLRILENVASRGHDVIKLLLTWRQQAPGDALDHYLLSRGIPLEAPKWEKERAKRVIDRFIQRMRQG